MSDSLPPDPVKLFLDRHLLKGRWWESQKETNAAFEGAVRVPKGMRDLLRCALHAGWIGNAPVSRHGVTRPIGTAFSGGVIADGEDEVHLRCAGGGELIPG